MPEKIFHLFCIGFIAGVFLGSMTDISSYSAFLLGIISLFCLLFFVFVSNKEYGVFIFITVFAFSFGILRFHMEEISPSPFLEPYIGKEITLSGIIVDDPHLKENVQRFTVETENEKNSARILVSYSGEELRYGDDINIKGKIKKPENFITDQGKEFDYINYLKKDGVFHVIFYPEIKIISRGNGSPLKEALFKIKESFLKSINKVLSPPESFLMSGLVLGEKSFDNSLRKDFIDTGTIHIVSLSGYNVTIVAQWIMKIFSSLPKNFGAGAGIFSIFLFVIMTGASATGIRAGIMATLVLFSKILGRNYDAGRALLLAGVTMILINPYVLYFDVSFELSFLAAFAVIYFSPKFDRYFLWVTSRFGLRDILQVTFATYVFVLPFLLYKMGNLSMVALPANTLVLPFIPFTMIFGFLTGFVGVFSYLFSVPLGFISNIFLKYEISMIRFFADMPFASINIPDFPLIVMVLMYIYFLYIIFKKNFIF